jgi:peptidoglycan hydrolase CwlO-like protein
MSEHDEMCARQDRELSSLHEQLAYNTKDMAQIISRVQDLVNEYHEMRISLARIENDIATLKDDMHEVKATLREKVAGRDEFLTVRNQLWAGVGVIVLGLLGGIVAWILQGGAKVH